MSTPVADLTVRKSVTVVCSVEHAFATFTEGIDAWWPLSTHSVGKRRARRAVVEGKTGGRIYEVWDDGAEHEWGSVLVWEPPRRVVYSWQPNPERPAPTEVEVRFVSEGDGTRVELEHRGWERLGDVAAEAREGYESGWDTVLGAYAARAGE
jgi:uncharacterized protein YndB with AHSA1/START domain